MADEDGRKPKVSQVRKAWNRTAPDFHRALAAGKFPPAHALLIQQAHEESWTRASLAKSEAPFAFRLNLSALARALDLSRTNLTEQFAALVRCRVFLAVGDGSFLINKDYREWLDPAGRPRLSPGDVRWCYDAFRVWGKSDGVSAQADSGVSEVSDSASQPPRQGVSVGADSASQPPRHPAAAPQTPVEDRAGQTTLIQTLKTTPPEGAAAAAETGRPGGRNGTDGPPGKVYEHPLRSAGHAALVEHCRSLFGDPFAAAVAEQGRDIDDTLGGRYDLFAAAVDYAKLSGKRINNLYAYCLRTANNFAARGLPSAPVAAAPRPHVPPPAGPPGGYFTHDGPPKRYRKPGTPPAPEPEGIDS